MKRSKLATRLHSLHTHREQNIASSLYIKFMKNDPHFPAGTVELKLFARTLSDECYCEFVQQSLLLLEIITVAQEI